MPEIKIKIRNKLPILEKADYIVADNSDYTIRFDFDEEWGRGEKTVYFVRSNGYAFAPLDTVDDTVSVPVQNDVKKLSILYVGVKQGDIKTSRPCEIKLFPAITDHITDGAVQPAKSMWKDFEEKFDKVDTLTEGLGIVKHYREYLHDMAASGYKFYAHKSTTVRPSDNEYMQIYDPIPIKAGVTYYYRNLYAYFCNAVYTDGSIAAFTEDTGAYLSGSFIAERDGHVYLTVRKNDGYSIQFTDSEIIYNSGITQDMIEYNKLLVPPMYTVEKDGSGDYTSLLKCLLTAAEHPDSVVYVGSGVYDLVQEFEEHYGSDFFTSYNASSVKGIILKNRIKVIFSSGAVVRFNYTGDNTEVLTKFSPFNSGEYGFTLENMRLESSNCRYCVHDERSTNEDAYENVYLNCSMYQDNSANTAWATKTCIGGGLGKYGNVRVENCVFESVGINNGYAITAWHNSKAAGAKSTLVVKGNYFKGKSTFRLTWYGESEEITTALVSNNSLGAAIVHRAETSDGTSPNMNTEIIEWNNEIRA